MSKVPLNEEDFNPTAHLLAVDEEKEVNSILRRVPIEYLAQITMSKDKTSNRTGSSYLELTLSIDRMGRERVSINDILSYVPAARWKITEVVEKLKLDKKALDTDDFMGLWVLVTLGMREYEVGEADPITGNFRKQKQNIISSYIRLASPEEVSKAMGVDGATEAAF